MVVERGLGSDIMEAFNSRPVYTHEGTYRRTLATGQIVEVADTSADPDFLYDVGSRARSVTNVPLITEHRAIGLIAIDGLPKDDTARRLLMALADIAAVAIDKERLHQETADRLAEVSTLYTLSTQITGSLSLSRVMESIVTILKVTINCRACSIFLLDPLTQALRLEASSGLPDRWRTSAQLKTDQGIGGRVFRERRAIYIPDAQSMPDLGYFDPQAGSLLVVPLIVRNQVIGLLALDDTRPNALSDEIRLLTIVAAQAAVAIENAQLYESLQASYHDLEAAYDALRELDRMKSELIQNISHELRTPLTFIRGYLELLQDGDMGDMNREQKAALDIVADKASLLSRLVDDIITLQYGREHIQLHPLPLAEVGRNALRAAQASADQAQIALRHNIPDDLPPVLGDEQRLSQVLDNLLSNALKFSSPGGTVTVSMCQEGRFIRTEVEDQGIGIPADKLHHVFERFYQVDGSTARRFGGTGLGLSIVKQIVETHGGQVGVHSKQNEGSCFYFTIPQAPSS
jgi:signal transduction histidine kinase